MDAKRTYWSMQMALATGWASGWSTFLPMSSILPRTSLTDIPGYEVVHLVDPGQGAQTVPHLRGRQSG